jgi:hypothetical protein
MPALKETYTNEENTVSLKIQNILDKYDPDACEEVWKVIQLMTDIKQGEFVLRVNKKVTGQSNANGAVKVLGPANRGDFLTLKFQTSADSCYEGTLSLRVYGGQLEYVSKLQEAVRKVTGYGWFDPKQPEVKHIPRPSMQPAPLATVGTALVAAATETAVGNGHISNRSVKGLVKDYARAQAILQKIAAKLEGGLVGNHDLSAIIMGVVTGKETDSGRGAGPVVAAWRKLGYLQRVSEDGRDKRYTLTAKAKTDYDLVFEPYKGKIESPLSAAPKMTRFGKRMGRPPKARSGEKMLGRFTKAVANCQKLEKIRADIAVCLAKKKKLDKRIAKLNKAAQKPSLLESEALVKSLEELKLK